MARSGVAVIIPAYNEASTIGDVVRGILPHGSPIVVDDASTDSTGDAARSAGAQVIRHERNMGYDEALNSGFSAAADGGFDYAVTMDADGQHEPSQIGEFVRLLEQGADLVIGVRPKKARVTESLFSCMTSLLYGIRDPLCGIKGYRISLLRDAGRFDSYGSIGTELMMYAAKRKYKIDQAPVSIGGRRQGTPRFGRAMKANWAILRAMVKAAVI